MGHIIKKVEAGRGRVAPFGRDALEEFPEKPLEPEAVEDAPAVPEDVFDPEALRAEVLAAARAEAERLVQEAYAEGLRRGEASGRAAFEARLAHAAEALGAAAAAMQAAREAFLESLEPQVVELVTLIAERVVQRECASDPELILRTVRRALETISDRQRLTVRLNPEDVAALRAHEVRLLEDFPGLQPLLIEPDPAVTAGGCTVDSATAHVDARLETLLANVIDALLDRSHESR